MLKTGQILFLYTRCYQTLLSSNTLIRLNCIGSRTSCYSSIIQGISRLSAFNSRQPSVVLEKKRMCVSQFFCILKEYTLGIYANSVFKICFKGFYSKINLALRFCSIPSSNSLNQQQQDNHLSPKDNGRYKIVTVPNFLCITRIGLTPLIGYLVMQHQYCPAFILFVIAGFTDLLDGFIARNIAGQKSLLGSVLDPMADKLLISCMFVTMTHAGLIPLPLTIVVILRDVCLIIGGFYKRYHSMDPPYSINRFFNPEVSSIQIVPTWMSKINTVLQLSLVAASLASPVFQFGVIGEKIITGLCWTTSITTVYSGLQYAKGGAFKKIR